MAQTKKAGTYLGDNNLPSPNAEYEYTPEMLNHIKRSKKNLLYFAEYFFFIINPDEGRQKIKLYDSQKRCLRTLRDNRKVILLASRQIGKTTLMTIYALWEACFNKDKNIVIVANKEATAKEIFKRVQLAYKELPNWIKPGVAQWGQTSCEFENGSRIWISTTTGSSARGTTINVLILDELAFIEPQSILDDFWRSVYPTISRAKTSKVLIASTPNGTGNLFHRLVDQAERNEEGNEFVIERIYWYDIPDRDEAWKKKEVAQLGSLESFQQEYECVFLNSGDTSIDEELFAELKKKCYPAPTIIDEGRYHIWETPDPDRMYVAGIDVSEGVNQDASVIDILDITDLKDIKQVAHWYDKQIPPAEFATKCKEILANWGNPFALIERNNQGGQVADRLGMDLQYENLVSYGAKQAHRKNIQLGMISHTNTKYRAVINQRYFINEARSFTFRHLQSLEEFKTFMRYPTGVWKAAPGKHDDRVMSIIWALMILEKEITERYFDIVKLDDFGKPLQLDRMDFGIKYFMDSTSIYTNESNDGFANSGIAPVLFGWGNNLAGDMADLEMEGWSIL